MFDEQLRQFWELLQVKQSYRQLSHFWLAGFAKNLSGHTVTHLLSVVKKKRDKQEGQYVKLVQAEHPKGQEVATVVRF